MPPAATSTRAASAPKRRTQRLHVLPVALLTATYLTIATVVAAVGKNHEFLMYVGVVAVLLPAVWIIDHRVHLSTAMLWALSAWGLAHMVGGLVVVPERFPIDGPNRVLYSLWLWPHYLKYDQLVHAYGVGVMTVLCWQGLRTALVRRAVVPRPSIGLLVLTAAAAMGFGALSELVEFVAVLVLPRTNVGGYLNTGWDLVANLVGAAVAAALIYRRETREG